MDGVMDRLASLGLMALLVIGGVALVYWILREIADAIEALMEDPE